MRRTLRKSRGGGGGGGRGGVLPYIGYTYRAYIYNFIRDFGWAYKRAYIRVCL